MIELLTKAPVNDGEGSEEACLLISSIANSHIARVQESFILGAIVSLASSLGLNSAEPHAPGG